MSDMGYGSYDTPPQDSYYQNGAQYPPPGPDSYSQGYGSYEGTLKTLRFHRESQISIAWHEEKSPPPASFSSDVVFLDLRFIFVAHSL